MFSDEWPDWQAAERAIRAGRLAPYALWKQADHAIQCWEPRVHAFLHYDREAVERQARAPGPGAWSGAPLVVKDLADVAGMPTTGGSRAYRMRPARDAAVVRRWREAGAVLLGKTNTEELAFGVITAPTTNPWDSSRIPGGSSGGTAAAVAAGMAMGGLGTDTAGSIRIPAALCGVVGFKPTFGALPTTGIMALAPSFDTVGPLAHSVADAAALFGSMGGAVRDQDAWNAGARVPVLVPDAYWSGRLDADVARAWAHALGVLEAAGCRVEPMMLDPWAHWRDVFLAVRRPESFLVHRRVLEGPRRSQLGGNLAARLEEGRDVSAVDYLAAQAERRHLIAQYRRRMGAGVMVLPTVGVVAPRVGEDRVRLPRGATSVWEALVSLTLPASVLGFPAVSVPMGESAEGLPTGLQIVGVPGADQRVLAMADWWTRQAALTPGRPSLPLS